MPDQEIIDLIRANKSDKALHSLYKYFPMVLKVIRYNGGNRQDAEDVFQEALIILCKRVQQDNFILTARLSTYLFSVCRFLWKDELKKRKHTLSADFETSLTGSEEQVLNGMLEKENHIKLAEKVLNELGDRCQELLLLFYHSGLKLKDIALKMGYSAEHTAKNQKYKCLEAAKNKLKAFKQNTQTL
jgi:RNA polymerase sigma factor (sigma-70 family)